MVFSMMRLFNYFTPFPPDVFREMGLHPFTLSFRGRIERDFLDEYNAGSLNQARFAFLAGLVLYSIFAYLDYIVAPEVYNYLWTIRFAVILPFSCAVIAVSFMRNIHKIIQPLLFVWVLVGGAGIIEMVRIMPPPVRNDYPAGLILVFMFTFIFSRIRFKWAALAGLVLITWFEITVRFFTDIPKQILLSNDFFMYSSAMSSLVGCYIIEFTTRRTFYLNRMVSLEHQKTLASTQELEQRVVERTEQLSRANEELRREMDVRKLSVEALLMNEEKYRTLFETFIVPIVIASENWSITDINQAGLTLFGMEEEHIFGQPMESLFDDAAEFGRLREELAATDQVRNFSISMRKKNDTRIECMVSTAVRRDDDGALLNYQVFINDITEHRRLESQLIQAQKMESVGRLAGGIAHDFNNLLTVIIGNADIIDILKPADGKIGEYVQEIKHTAERAANLTRQLLTFSRRQIVEPRVINANEILIDMDRMFRRLIGEDIEMVTLLEEKLWPVRIDPGQIEQVLTNIIVNARDAMPSGGKLTIETANITLDAEYIAAHPDLEAGDYIMVAVSDTGIGMNREVANRIFEPFFTTKEKGKGTGLGLSTCYGIVKQNGGHILVHSKPGHGSTFVVYLPRTSGVSEEVKLRVETSDYPRGTELILIAEDEPAVRQMITKVISDAGYTVIEAFNGEEALRKCELHGFGNIDLLITDMIMPQMGGRELSEHVRRKNPRIRILFISGYTDDSMIRKRIEEPGAAFLQKPFTPASLVQKIRQLLDQPVGHYPIE
jgi:PAS domain S-box-containing protein